MASNGPVSAADRASQAKPRSEEARFKELMDRHHYLGAPPKIGESAFYAAVVDGQWVALSSFYACALKSSAWDRRLGWHPRDRTPRLYLITNQSRFLVLKSAANLASRTLSLLERRIAHYVWDISLAFRPGRLTE